MTGLRLEVIRKILQADVEGCFQPGQVIGGVSTDSREIEGGELFFALQGENFDGHSFVAEAFQKGARGAVVKSGKVSRLEGDPVLFVVDSPLEALQKLAAAYRRRCGFKVVGITGSTGKTTVKDMTHSILRYHMKAGKTEGNYNNQIGVPLTLLGMERDTEVAVVEMGMSARGEVAKLASMAAPDIGVVLNVGPTHIEHLGSLRNIARAKAELIQTLGEEHTAVLNADDRRVRQMASLTRARILYFGETSPWAEVRPENCQVLGREGVRFALAGPRDRALIHLPLPGRHFVSGALAAAAVASVLGLSMADCRRGLENPNRTGMRLEIEDHGWLTLINDAYNASPQSMCAAIDFLKELDPRRRKVAFLGGMFELGRFSVAEHRRLGMYIHKQGIDVLCTLGETARPIVCGALKAGMEGSKIRHFPDKKQARLGLPTCLKEGDILLIKGSRGNRLEDIVTYLKDTL